ncbi:MAG: FprA family A-type flavoprotein, partial [Phycisphaerales bacterium]
IIGSFGWGGTMVEEVTGMLTNLKVEVLPPVIAKGRPKDEDYAALDALAEQILDKHRGIGVA